MLELRPSCECCRRELPADSDQAVICTFECTFCHTCAHEHQDDRCPNCGGNFAPRPIRPADALLRHPASTVRVERADGCGAQRSPAQQPPAQ